METLYAHTYATSVGPVCITANEEGVSSLAFLRDVQTKRVFNAAAGPAANIVEKPSAFTNQCANELMEYLAGKRRYFDVPLSLAGSEFEVLVWQSLRNIPFASTATCTDIAAQLGNAQSFRAVSRAIGKNALPLLIPDHRVVSSSGAPLGTGETARRRKAILDFELMQAGLAR